MIISGITRNEFTDYLSSWTLREIKDLFESESVFHSPDYRKPQQQQRRSLINAYIQSLELSNLEDARKLLRVIEHVLVKLTAIIEDYPSAYGTPRAEHARKNLIRWLQRDGIEFRDNRLIAMEKVDRVEMEKPDLPSPLERSVIETRSEATPQEPPKVFISYSWDDDDHKQWVQHLARELRGNGIDVKLDCWEVRLGDSLPRFMEESVRANDFVVIILTPNYRAKSDGRKGGVGYEGDIMTGELFSGKDPRKFIPVLRKGDWQSATPSWLIGKRGADLRGTPYSADQFDDLVATVFGAPVEAPPLGPPPIRKNHITSGTGVYTAPSLQDESPIRIINIVVSEVGTPKNDGTDDSALYAVPFQLSRQPSRAWITRFLRTWDSPPNYTTMHRPGIARIVGDRLILDGTTIDEVEKYHRATLKSVIDRVNRDIAAHEHQQKQREQEKLEELRQHRRTVEDTAKRITFE